MYLGFLIVSDLGFLVVSDLGFLVVSDLGFLVGIYIWVIHRSKCGVWVSKVECRYTILDRSGAWNMLMKCL